MRMQRRVAEEGMGPPSSTNNLSSEPVSKQIGPSGRFVRSPVGVSSLGLLLVIGAACAFAPLLTDKDPQLIDLTIALQGPSSDHPLGTDESGRDVLSRLLYGGRISLMVGLAAMSISVVVGTLLGVLGGYFGGWVDRFVVQIVDGLLAVPIFFFWLIALASLGSTTLNIILIIGLTSWMPTARVVRAEAVRVRSLDFVEAGNALGATHGRLIARYVLPQATPVIIVSATLATAFAILSESALSYLGVGVQPPLPSWGRMLSVAQNHIWEMPMLAVWPGLMVLLTVLLFNLMGDALQSAINPKA